MLGSMSRRRSAALALSVLMFVACGTTDQGVVARRSDEQPSDTSSDDTVDPTDPTDPTDSTDSTDSTVDPTDPTSPLDPTVDSTPPPADGGIIDFGEPKTPRDYDNFLNAAFTDITEFWTENFPATYGGAFEPVSGIYALYPEREVLPQSCEGPVPYDEVEGNAFYTTCGDIIVYDDAELLPELVDNLGAAAVGVVAAHEYGHAIQARSGVFDMNLPTVDTEQQADCFAGAWAAHVARGESDTLPQFDDRDIKGGLIAMITVRDPPSDLDVASDPNGHGTGFDRVGAFQEGFINGVARCADFIANPNPRIDLVFTPEEFATGGNLAYDDILAALPIALDTFWLPTLQASSITFTSPTLQPFTVDGEAPSCDDRSTDELVNTATFCVSTNTIVYDDAFVHDLYGRLGDLSFSYPIAAAYSDAVQVALQSALTGEPRVLLDDCLVGAWIVDIVPSGDFDENGFPTPRNPSQEITLSAGDLDEAVQTAVLLGDETSDTDVNGTAFEKIDAFRAGVLGGLDACQNRIG
jgi:predicted metalloprotease